MEFSGEKIT